MNKKKSKLVKKLIKGEELNLNEANFLGDTSEIDFDYPITYGFKKYKKIGQGAFGQVYTLFSNKKALAAKIPKESYDLEIIKKGYEIQKEAYSKKINCPNPEGMFNIYDFDEKKFKKAFVMEKIYAKDLFDWENEYGRDSLLIKQIKNKRNKEIKKARENKLYPRDSSDNGTNVLYNEREKKIYLIDMDLWEK